MAAPDVRPPPKGQAGSANTVDQSCFTLTTVQPWSLASDSACSAPAE